jgi:hypothetical protein
MAIEKVSVIDQITITENGIVLWRVANRIMENGEMLSQAYDRNSIQPGDDTARVPAKVKAIIDVAWTPEVVQAFADAMQAQKQAAPIAEPIPAMSA